MYIYAYCKAQGKLGNIVAETLFPANGNVSPCFPEWANARKHGETSNVSEFGRKHFCFPGSKFCFRNNVSTGGETFEETSRITNVSATMFPSLPRA